MPLILAMDIGTSSAKCALFDTERSRIVASVAHEYPLHSPAPGHAVQDPDDWWRAVIEGTRALLAAHTGQRDVVAIGLSGQMHGTVLLDAAQQPLTPAIIWADQRSHAECSALAESVGAARLVRICGTMPASGFMAASLLWLKKHQPELLDSARWVLLPKDYVRLKLTGEIATDASDAASTALFDITARQWSAEIMRAVGLSESLFPSVLDSAQVAGMLTRDAADLLGLPSHIPVVIGCADQPAQALANGLLREGVASVTCGTGGQVFVPLIPRAGTPPPTDPRVHVFNHAARDTLYVLGAILAAGLSLRWLRNTLGLAADPDAYPRLSADAAQVDIGADGLLFLPYLVGERTPHMDSQARGAFVGLTYTHGRGHLARAVMEGVAFALRQALEICLTLGAPVDQLIVSGGGAESAVWRQIQADVFGLPLRKTLTGEQTSIGAALLAAVGVGLYTTLAEASAATARFGPPTEPNAANHARYNAHYAAFLDLYPHLRADLHRLSTLGGQQTLP